MNHQNASTFSRICVLILCACTLMSAQAAETYDITAVKHKMESKEEKLRVRGPGPKTIEREIDTYYYGLTVRNKSPLNPAGVHVQYIVYLEQAKGHVTPAVFGTGKLSTPLGKSAAFKTEPFNVRSLEWDRKHRKDVERSAEVDGYAIRLLDPSGEKVLAEKFSSARIKSEVDWSVLTSKRKDPVKPRGPAPFRGKKPRPGK